MAETNGVQLFYRFFEQMKALSTHIRKHTHTKTHKFTPLTVSDRKEPRGKERPEAVTTENSNRAGDGYVSPRTKNSCFVVICPEDSLSVALATQAVELCSRRRRGGVSASIMGDGGRRIASVA